MAKFFAAGRKTFRNVSENYFHDVKINFQTVKIYFHDVKIDFQSLKIVLCCVVEDFLTRSSDLPEAEET